MTALKKSKISKDWYLAEPKKSKVNDTVRKIHKFEHFTVTRSEDLPELMTTTEAAQMLHRHPKTIEEYRKDGILRFIKIRGRYFTTPEYIAEFIESEMKKK